MSDYSDHPDGLTEAETLARLTIEEKRRIAEPAILEFPHLTHGMLDTWLREHGTEPTPGASLSEKATALLDRCQELVRSDEDPEALDRFVYGQLYPAHLRALDIDSEDLIQREPVSEAGSADE